MKNSLSVEDKYHRKFDSINAGTILFDRVKSIEIPSRIKFILYYYLLLCRIEESFEKVIKVLYEFLSAREKLNLNIFKKNEEKNPPVTYEDRYRGVITAVSTSCW